MEFLLIVFLTLLQGVFAMSELALAASRRLNAMAATREMPNGVAVRSFGKRID